MEGYMMRGPKTIRKKKKQALSGYQASKTDVLLYSPLWTSRKAKYKEAADAEITPRKGQAKQSR